MVSEEDAKDVVDWYIEWVKENLREGYSLEDYLDEKQ